MIEYPKFEHPEKPAPIIVCAAVRSRVSGLIVTGARHYDAIMREQIKSVRSDIIRDDGCAASFEQGFINQFGEFHDRKEAWVIAERNGQIRSQVSEPGTLYSENLY